MKTLKKHVQDFVKAEEGATMVEYGLLVALISVVAIVAIASVGGYVNGAFKKVEAEVSKAGISK